MDITFPAQSLPVYEARDFRAVSGANEGDVLSFAADLVLDDVYGLLSRAELKTLDLQRRPDGLYRIARNSETGRANAIVHLDSTLTLMAHNGVVVEAIVLVEVDNAGHAEEVYLLPLAPLLAKTEYQLVGIDTENLQAKFAEISCVSFAGGTHITTGSGDQRRIEDLKPGDPVLTRDNGVQRIRCIVHSTQRALGAFAPVRIAAGTLNNANDLVVSPDHRLFLYRRPDSLEGAPSEQLVEAQDLVNGTTVTVLTGGFIDYYQLVFDTHQIVYAEGIAAEAMPLEEQTAPLFEQSEQPHVVPATRRPGQLKAHNLPHAPLAHGGSVDLPQRAAR
jgi:hypothetical protein